MYSADCEVVRRLVEEVANRGRMTLVDDLVSADFREHAGPPSLPSDREVLKQDLASRRLFGSGSDYAISELRAREGLVALTLEERSGGPRPISAGVHTIRVEQGKIAEHWGAAPLFATPTL